MIFDVMTIRHSRSTKHIGNSKKSQDLMDGWMDGWGVAQIDSDPGILDRLGTVENRFNNADALLTQEMYTLRQSNMTMETYHL